MHRIAVRTSAAIPILLSVICSFPPGGDSLAAGNREEPVFTACLPGSGPAGTAARRAEPGDIHVFDPYIGRFRSKTFRDEDSGKSFHYVAEYAWFDANRSIVRFTVSTIEEGGSAETVNGQGFYGYDPFNERLYVLGVFSSGTTGFGCVGEFDPASKSRVTWARSRSADGTTIHVRDSFEVVDKDTWKDVTSIRPGNDGEWKVVYQDTFTRIGE